MKKSILLTAMSCIFIAISVNAYCQSKPADTAKTVKKQAELIKPPAYVPDVKKVYKVTIEGRIDQLQGLNFVVSKGMAIVDSTDYPAKLRYSVKAYAGSVIDKIARDVNTVADADKAKWKADSVKSAMVKPATAKKP